MKKMRSNMCGSRSYCIIIITKGYRRRFILWSAGRSNGPIDMIYVVFFMDIYIKRICICTGIVRVSSTVRFIVIAVRHDVAIGGKRMFCIGVIHKPRYMHQWSNVRSGCRSPVNIVGLSVKERVLEGGDVSEMLKDMIIHFREGSPVVCLGCRERSSWQQYKWKSGFC